MHMLMLSLKSLGGDWWQKNIILSIEIFLLFLCLRQCLQYCMNVVIVFVVEGYVTIKMDKFMHFSI